MRPIKSIPLIHSGNLTTRIVWSLLFEVLLFVVTVGLAMSDTSDIPGVFFWITMATVVLLNSEFRREKKILV